MNSTTILDHDPDAILEKILAVTKEYEFKSFVLGIERPKEYSREIHEAAFRALKIQLGSRLCEAWTDREVDFENPELRIDLRKTRSGFWVELQAIPLFIGGRYRKLSREIPACRWMHMRCKGKGCPSCDFTGNMCGPSIQELAEPAVLEAIGGKATFFHGAGREDVDVRMLGNGRPFVVEIRQPRKRSLDLERLTRNINDRARSYAEVHRLALTDRESMIMAKSAAAEKTYRAWIRFEGHAPAETAQRLEQFGGAEIDQLSPTRVMKRRGKDTVRKKRVISSAFIGADRDLIIWEVRTSSGTYIKELISGDGGRTRPSVSSILEHPCHCAVLDVMEIHWTPPWEEEA